MSALTPAQLDQLIAYVLQIDGELPVRRLPFEPPAPQLARTGAPAGGTTGAGGASDGGGVPQPSVPSGGGQPGVSPESGPSCALVASSGSSGQAAERAAASALFGALIALALGRRRRRGTTRRPFTEHDREREMTARRSSWFGSAVALMVAASLPLSSG